MSAPGFMKLIVAPIFFAAALACAAETEGVVQDPHGQSWKLRISRDVNTDVVNVARVGGGEKAFHATIRGTEKQSLLNALDQAMSNGEERRRRGMIAAQEMRKYGPKEQYRLWAALIERLASERML